MDNARKRFSMMNWLKWLGIVFGAIMFLCTKGSFGVFWGIALGVFAAAGFFQICEREAQQTICKLVADDLKEAVIAAGHNRCLVEIKSFRIGLVTRVYLINAGKRAPLYGKAVIHKINTSWYKERVWATQLVELKDESEIAKAKQILDQELVSDMKRMQEEEEDETGGEK